jgi:hypothetical protein
VTPCLTFGSGHDRDGPRAAGLRSRRRVTATSLIHIRQEPVIKHSTEASARTIGTVVRVRWPNSPIRSILVDAKAQFLQVADAFTWLNPHLTLTTDWIGERTAVEATIPAWDKWKPSDPTSVHWYEPQHLERLIAAYLSHDQDNGRERTVREFVAEFRGLSGTAKQKKVLDTTGLSREPLSRLINGHSLDAALVTSLLIAMQGNSKPVKPKALGDHRRGALAQALRGRRLRNEVLSVSQGRRQRWTTECRRDGLWLVPEG